jgi:L-threonylcarbamoyladenylate synthase
MLPDVLRGPEGGVAVRWTSHPGMAQLIATLGSPITSTSANRPRQPPALDAVGVAADFEPAVRARELLVLDAGRLTPSPPSTLVDCTGGFPRVIRVGALDPGALRAIVPSVAP